MTSYRTIKVITVAVLILFLGVMGIYILANKKKSKPSATFMDQAISDNGASATSVAGKSDSRAAMHASAPATIGTESPNEKTYYGDNYASVQNEASRSIDSTEFKETIQAMRRKRDDRLTERK